MTGKALGPAAVQTPPARYPLPPPVVGPGADYWDYGRSVRRRRHLAAAAPLQDCELPRIVREPSDRPEIERARGTGPVCRLLLALGAAGVGKCRPSWLSLSWLNNQSSPFTAVAHVPCRSCAVCAYFHGVDRSWSSC